jgi:hypothetical protein
VQYAGDDKCLCKLLFCNRFVNVATALHNCSDNNHSIGWVDNGIWTKGKRRLRRVSLGKAWKIATKKVSEIHPPLS